MKFEEVVRRAKTLHVDGTLLPAPEGGLSLAEMVYGRICSSASAGPPEKIGSSHRKTVFVFGSDAIESIVLKQDAYDILLSLGFDRAYIKHEVHKSSLHFVFVNFSLILQLPKMVESSKRGFPAIWE